MRTRTTAVCIALASVVLLSAHAGHSSEGIAGYRHDVMEAIGGHTGALALILKKQAPFTEDAKTHAQSLAALATITDKIFPAGSGGGKSEALPAIWEKPDAFKARVVAFQEAAAALARDVEAGAPWDDSFQKMIKSCKSCHDDFKKKD